MTGRYSKHLPTRLLARYEAALRDQELLSLRDEIGLVDTRLGEVVSALDTGESRAAWEQLSEDVGGLRSAMARLEELLRDNPVADPTEAIRDLRESVNTVTKVVDRGLSEQYAWTEIRGLIKQRGEVVAGERQRLEKLSQTLTVEQSMTLMVAVLDAVRRNVTDRDTLERVSSELERLMAVGAGRPTPGRRLNARVMEATSRPAD